ncbi:MAG: PilZ domain-containing protein [Pseudolabrys sp.]|jgi:hypothetical protein
MSTRFSLMDQFKVRRSAKDARRFARRSVRLQGWIRSAGDFAVQSCVVVDMSPTGARIRVESPNHVSDHFNLLLSRHEANGRRCRVKWRRGDALGVAFV